MTWTTILTQLIIIIWICRVAFHCKYLMPLAVIEQLTWSEKFVCNRSFCICARVAELQTNSDPQTTLLSANRKDHQHPGRGEHWLYFHSRFRTGWLGPVLLGFPNPGMKRLPPAIFWEIGVGPKGAQSLKILSGPTFWQQIRYIDMFLSAVGY